MTQGEYLGIPLSNPFLRRKVWSGQIVATDEDLLLLEEKVEELIFCFLQEESSSGLLQFYPGGNQSA